MNHIEYDASNNSSVVAYVFVAARMYLLSSCLAMMGEGIHSSTDQGDFISLFLLFFKIGKVGQKKTLGLAYAYTII
jgi:hypothetical protein